MDEVEQFWSDSLKRRALAEGRSALRSGAANPYADPTARAAWQEGYDQAAAWRRRIIECRHDQNVQTGGLGYALCHDCGALLPDEDPAIEKSKDGSCQPQSSF